MKIDTILSQNRRDFRAIYVCEHCGYQHEDRGYDDAYFHQHVIPNMACHKCGKKAPATYRPLSPTYPEGMQI